jgi:hypothetical protein
MEAALARAKSQSRCGGSHGQTFESMTRPLYSVVLRD